MPRHGEGIYKREDGRWEARYIHHYENGKAKYRFLYAKTYTEVKAKRKAEYAMLQPGVPKEKGTNLQFREIANLRLSEKQGTVKESTYVRYIRSVQVYLLPLLENQKINKLTVTQLERLPEQLLVSGGKTGLPLSPKTVSDILCVLKAILKYAKANRYTGVDPASFTLPKKQTTDKIIIRERQD